MKIVISNFKKDTGLPQPDLSSDPGCHQPGNPEVSQFRSFLFYHRQPIPKVSQGPAPHAPLPCHHIKRSPPFLMTEFPNWSLPWFIIVFQCILHPGTTVKKKRKEITSNYLLLKSGSFPVKWHPVQTRRSFHHYHISFYTPHSMQQPIPLDSLFKGHPESDLPVPLLPWRSHHPLLSGLCSQPTNHLCFSCLSVTIACHITYQNSSLMPHITTKESREYHRAPQIPPKTGHHTLCYLLSLDRPHSLSSSRTSLLRRSEKLQSSLTYWIFFVPLFPHQNIIYAFSALNSSFIKSPLQTSQVLKILSLFKYIVSITIRWRVKHYKSQSKPLQTQIQLIFSPIPQPSLVLGLL